MSVRKLWDAQKQAVGFWQAIGDHRVTSLLVSCGYHFGVADFQHGFATFDNCQMIAQTMHHKGVTPFARMSNMSELGRILDLGFEGVICPMIEHEDEVDAFVKGCYYQPQGLRSWGPCGVTPFLQSREEYFENFKPITFAMIETRQAIERVEKICSHPDLDGVFIGPSDLSVCLEEPFQGHNENSQSQKVMRKIEAAARAHNKKIGIYCFDGKTAAIYKKLGYDFITATHDTPGLVKIGSQELKDFHASDGSYLQ